MKTKLLALIMILITVSSYAGSYYVEFYSDTPASKDDSFYADASVTFSLTTAVYAGTVNYSIIGVNGEQSYDFIGLRSSNDSWGEYNTVTSSPLSSDTYDITEDVGGGYAKVSANW